MNAYVYRRGVIESGKYGKLESLTMRRYSKTPMWSWDNWFLDEKRSGHVALDLMVHDVDYMQSVFGEPKAITGVYHPMTDNTNYAFANYIYNGFAVSVETGWYNDQGLRFTADFKAVFEKGNLLLKDGQLYENNTLVDLANPEKIGETGINISNVDGYAGEIKYFIECIRSGEPNEKITAESAQATIKLVERTLAALTKV
jgi:predicted dehydrogenase